MITNPDSPSAVAFRKSAKNIAAQCSIQAAKLQEEMKAEKSESTNKEFTESTPEVAPETTTQN